MTPSSLYDLVPNRWVEQVDLVALFGVLLLAHGAGWALARLRGRATRWLGLAGLCALLKLIAGQQLLTVAMVSARYWTGTARVASVSTRDPDRSFPNPDPVSRIPHTFWRECGDPRWDKWSNQTLELLVDVFGASPNAYRGPYPDQARARLILDVRGERPIMRGEKQLVFSSGEVFELYEITPEGARRFESLNPGMMPYSAELSNLHISRRDIWRVAYLSPSSILAETETAIELRVWDRFRQGNVWASWDK